MATSITCSACNAANYRKCKCPWNKPFERWPEPALRKVQALTAGGRREGS